ncbi:MAG: nicotinate phosphoribosyltransferase, partial [Candidatus Hydrothermae bacterium]|nr:nicotinate phosphoribosyltransferase [Candidatus Hydrothermae bacterium]
MNRPDIAWITPDNLALFVDLYELTMAQSYHHRGYNPPVVFDYFVRHLPPERRFLVFAGLEQLVAYLQRLRFHPDALAYLSSLGMFRREFLDMLASFRFTGDLWSVPEGTVVFAGEVLVRVEAPLIQAQIIETAVLNLLNFETLIASKAARVVLAARGRGVVDFSPRRDHGLDAANKVARASYLVGALGTSNVLAGKLWGIPVFGTMAHSYVMAFPDERTAFRAFCEDYPERPVLL